LLVVLAYAFFLLRDICRFFPRFSFCRFQVPLFGTVSHLCIVVVLFLTRLDIGFYILPFSRRVIPYFVPYLQSPGTGLPVSLFFFFSCEFYAVYCLESLIMGSVHFFRSRPRPTFFLVDCRWVPLPLSFVIRATRLELMAVLTTMEHVYHRKS